LDPLERHLAHQLEHGREFFWHRLRWAVVSSYFPAGDFTLVDVGAGIGLVGELLAEQRPDAAYRFVEPIPFLEEELERRYGAAANAKGDTRYEGAAVVTLLDVLEHQEDDRAFMAELAGRLDEGATLVVTVPAGRRLWSGWDVALGHYRRYDRPSFRRAVGGLPLEVVELDYLFPELVPLALVRRLRRPEDSAGDAEFPELSSPVNEVLYRLGSVSLRLRRAWPLGTSLLAVLRRA
jgi:Methyltransferase domain